MPQPADRRLVTEEALGNLNASDVIFTPTGLIESSTVQLAVEEIVSIVTDIVTDIVVESITNDDTTHSPSGNVVYDALALKVDVVSGGYGRPTSTDGSFSLPVPTDTGLEFVITADALDDIRMDGVSL